METEKSDEIKQKYKAKSLSPSQDKTKWNLPSISTTIIMF